MRITLRELHARSLDGEGFVGEKIIRDAVTDYLAPHRRAAATYPLLVRLLGEPDSTPWATSLPQAYHVRALTNALMELVKFEPSLVETIVWHHREAAYCARKLGGEREASFFGVFGWVTPEACASQRLEALARLADRLKSRYRELWWHEYVAKEWSRL